jgi:hypothetical protein
MEEGQRRGGEVVEEMGRGDSGGCREGGRYTSNKTGRSST